MAEKRNKQTSKTITNTLFCVSLTKLRENMSYNFGILQLLPSLSSRFFCVGGQGGRRSDRWDGKVEEGRN